MDCEIKLDAPPCTEKSSLITKSDATLPDSDSVEVLKESDGVVSTSNKNESAEHSQEKETLADLQSDKQPNEKNHMEASKNSLDGDNNENKLDEKLLKSDSTCSSNVICNVEADVLPDSKTEYRNKGSLSEDSEEDSDSWEEDDESSTSSNSSSDSSSSSSVSSSSLASAEESDSDIFGNVETTNNGPPRTRGELSLEDLPKIQDLHITVPSKESQEIGTITSIVEQLVVIQAYKDTPALDLDSVLFLNEGSQLLGHVFDVFGPVKEPCYCVRFNNPQHVKDRGVKVGMKVYCAPKMRQHTRFVFLSELLRQKGCDASWEHNNEPPPNVVEYSDDEEERNARRLAKMQREQGKCEPDEELKKQHQTYEQRMNARNLRMSERHWNRFGKAGPISQARQNEMQQPGQFRGRMGGPRPGIPNNFRPWGPGPGHARPQVGPWGNNPSSHSSPQPPNMQPRPSTFVRPPAFSVPNYMQSPPAPFVPFPTTLLQNSQNQQLLLDTSVPPPPLAQSPCSVDTGIQLFPEQAFVNQQSNIVRSGSVPRGLHLSAIESFHQGGNQVHAATPPLYRSESMPSMLHAFQQPNYFLAPDTTRPPPPPSVGSMLSHQFGSTTFGNPAAFSFTPPCPAGPIYANPPAAVSPWQLPPPPPSETVPHYPQDVQQMQTTYHYGP